MGPDAFLIGFYECGLLGKKEKEWNDSCLVAEVVRNGERTLLRIRRFSEKTYLVFALEGDPGSALLAALSERLFALNLVEIDANVLFSGTLERSDLP